MLIPHPSGLSVSRLLRDGGGLTTREVLALLLELCRNPGSSFPLTPGDLWITETGELLVEQSGQAPPATDPRTAVADLLEAMLPANGQDSEHTVAPPLRSLPARLRRASGDASPQAREDLTSILGWHLAGDARQIIQQLVQRAAQPEVTAAAAPIIAAAATTEPVPLARTTEPVPLARTTQPAPLERTTEPTPLERRSRIPAAVEEVATVPAGTGVASRLEADYDLDLQANDAPTASPSPRLETPLPSHAARIPLRRTISALAIGALFGAIGTASYWFVRDQETDPRVTTEIPETTAADATAPPPPAAGDGPPAASGTSALATGASAAHPMPLPVADGAFSPSFAADGQELFFHSGHANAGRLVVASLDDSGLVSRVSTLLDERARNYHPRLSPDGQRLAFDSDRDGERGVYVSDRDGANPQRVSGSGYGAVPSWSPSMKWLAFVRGEPARPKVWNLWLRELTTGALQRHTSYRSGQVWGASWFPDGGSFCYSHETRLVISHLDSRQDIVIDTPRTGRLVRTPAVSPDGRHVVFQVFKDGVWLLDVQTRQMRRLLDDPSAEEFSWAPGGDRIAYHSRRDGTWRIWTMKVPR